MLLNKIKLLFLVWTVCQTIVEAQILSVKFSLKCKSLKKMCDFKLQNLLGNGAYGEVHKVTYDGIEIALKIGSMNDAKLGNEYEIYKLLGAIVDIGSPETNIEREGLPRIYGFGVIVECSDKAEAAKFLGRNVMLMMLLGDHLYGLKGTFTQQELQDILYQMMRSLNVLHRHDVVHNDIKPSNFLTVIVHPTKNDTLRNSAASQAVGPRHFKIYLVDFGDATIGEARSIVALSLGKMWGTVRYWSFHVHETYDNRGVKDYVQTPGSREDDLVALAFSVFELEFELSWRPAFNEFKRLYELKDNKLKNEGGEQVVRAKSVSEYEKGLSFKKEFPQQITEKLQVSNYSAVLLEIFEYGCQRYSVSESSNSKHKEKGISIENKEREFLDRLQPNQNDVPVVHTATTPTTDENVKKGCFLLRCFT